MAAAALTVFAAGAVLVAVPTGPVAAQSVPSSGGVVVIANGWSSADVGAAAPLAGRLDASVLYASASSLGDATEQALEQLAPSRVILVGGTGALKARVSSEVRRLLPDARVTRHNGSDRIDTAAKAALSAPAVPRGRPVVIANGWSPSDVGAAAPLAASLGGSLLFANRNSLGDPTVTALNRLGPSKVIIVGGTAALSTRIETELAGVVAGVRTQRLGGSDRVDTAARGAELADVGLGEPVVLANGWSAADVGIAAPLAAALDGSVLFTGRSALGVRTARALERLSPSRIDLVRQAERLQRFARDREWVVDEVVLETASGLDGQRRKLLRVLGQGGRLRLVVEHRDRLARFGFEMVEACVRGSGGEVAVIDLGETSRRARRGRHASRQRGVQMVVRAHQSWCRRATLIHGCERNPGLRAR